MGSGADHLRNKALLALEEAVQECRYRKPRRGFALRFALAYLWSLKPTDREPFENFWRELDENSMWRFSGADRALHVIYRHLGVERDHELFMAVWKRVQNRERGPENVR